jgi:glycosyltransferase involved in cell wall biosynthesis
MPAIKHIVQCARTIGPGYGVSGPSYQLEKAFGEMGYGCERFTLDDLGITTTAMPEGNWLVALLKFWRDVFVYSTLGSVVAWWKYRRRKPDTVVVCQVDAVYGDIFVVRSLHKAFLKRQANRHWMLLRNPLHTFVLMRDFVRFKSHIHRHFVALSEPNKQEIVEHYGVDPQRITVIPNGVDMKRFRPCDKSRAGVRGELGLTDSDLVGIFAGHEFERKGLPAVLEAWRLLREQGHRPKLIVAGRDDPARIQAEFADLKEDVRFVGNKNDVERYYAASDFMIMPTLHDISPLVGPEALATGLPILMTPVGGALAYLQHGVNGWFVERDATNIAQRLQIVIDDPTMLEQASANARDSVKDWDWSAIALRYLELFEDVMR